MTDIQKRTIMKTLASIEHKFLSAILSFVQKVEDAASAPYSVVMTRVLEWLVENGPVSVLLGEDGAVCKYEGTGRQRGDKFLIVRALEGNVCVCTDEPFTYSSTFGGRGKTDYYVALSVRTLLDCLVEDRVANSGDRPADITEYKRVAARQTLVADMLDKYCNVLLFAVSQATGETNVENEVNTLNDILSGKAAQSTVKCLAKKSPKGRTSSLAEAFDQNEDNDD